MRRVLEFQLRRYELYKKGSMRLSWIAVAARAIFGDLEIYVLPIVGIRDKNESTLSCCTKTE